MTAALDRRVEAMRRRVLVRSWEYRQRRHAHGVWFRLRRVLVKAGTAFVVPREEAELLLAEGFRPEPVGDELEPRKTILFVPTVRVARIASARAVPLRLGTELLQAEDLVLTPFEPIEPAG
jgi:hypothetical protein